MLSTQQILQSVIDMQANAQQALPVLPNNGNPMGANNMPHTGGMIQPRQQATPGDYDGSGINPAANRPGQRPSPLAERYPWLQPSPSMDNIREFLNSRRGMLQRGSQPQAQAPAPQQQAPAGLTPLPQQRPDLPVIPLRAMGR